ncbi:hypothetical protein WICPIJ_005616 [Wickerhamomyces pijperi]|uniref:Uncharacterized protein n=1 Tax=Wickerhamomyces pijperi TaxID=599730 RepID=A0A9P8Q5D6_WICPI|nr:hypothetical protein WICPIJ_005616 [Wickerhamomyces pijperi]
MANKLLKDFLNVQVGNDGVVDFMIGQHLQVWSELSVESHETFPFEFRESLNIEIWIYVDACELVWFKIFQVVTTFMTR